MLRRSGSRRVITTPSSVTLTRMRSSLLDVGPSSPDFTSCQSRSCRLFGRCRVRAEDRYSGVTARSCARLSRVRTGDQRLQLTPDVHHVGPRRVVAALGGRSRSCVALLRVRGLLRVTWGSSLSSRFGWSLHQWNRNAPRPLGGTPQAIEQFVATLPRAVCAVRSTEGTGLCSLKS